MPRRVSRGRKNSSRRKKKLSKKCSRFLKKKIGINMREYKEGRFKSPSQAIAVSYSQMRKKFPNC